MKTLAYFLVVYAFLEGSCENDIVNESPSADGPKVSLLSFASADVYKGLDPATFASQISDEYHTKGFACPKPIGNFVDTTDCQSFYMCSSDGKVKHLKCLPGFAFDSSQGYCCPKKNVLSCYPPVSDVGIANANATTTTAVNVTVIQTVRCTADGAYADPKDCSRYYICVNGKPMQFQCPRNTKFDKNSKNCLHSDAAVCFNSVRPNKKPSWIPRGPQGPRPKIEQDLIAQESIYSSFIAYH